MPIHDWTRVPSGLFHDFHQAWTIEIRNALNRGTLPNGYYALVEQRVDGPEPDVIAVELKRNDAAGPLSTVATLEPPQARLVARISSDAARYARNANRINVRHPLGHVVAVVEIVSPGNKDSRSSLRSFVTKAVSFLRNGIHLLIVDLFPPTQRDPRGIHQEIWDQLTDEPCEFVPGKPLTLVAYQAGDELTAYIEPLAIGDPMPDLPLFLAPDLFVRVPIEATYNTTWSDCPAPVRELVQDHA